MKKIICALLCLTLLGSFAPVYAEDTGADLSVNVVTDPQTGVMTLTVNQTIAAKSPTANIICDFSDPIVKFGTQTVTSTYDSTAKKISFVVSNAGDYIIRERTEDDNETDPIALKQEVELELNYKSIYSELDTTNLEPTTAKIIDDAGTEGLTINATDVNILYTNDGGSSYSSSSFPVGRKGNYKVTWTIKDSNINYFGSGEDTFEIVDKDAVLEYSVTYVLNGGTNDSSNPAKYYSNSSDITLNKATRKGYAFKGWYTESTFVNKVTAIQASMAKDLTLYAKFVKLGDVNGDTLVNSRDSVILRNYVLKKIKANELDTDAADLNGDNIINSLDRVVQRNVILKKVNLED